MINKCILVIISIPVYIYIYQNTLVYIYQNSGYISVNLHQSVLTATGGKGKVQGVTTDWSQNYCFSIGSSTSTSIFMIQ